MKINFKLDERKISKSSRSKIYDLGQVTTTVQNLLDNSEITITDNLIPIIKITSIDDEVSHYLLPDLNYEWGNISGRNTYSFTVNDLIALGGSSSSAPAPTYKEYNILLSQEETDDPVINKTITNTLGTTLTWSRNNTGVYESSTFYVPDFNTVSILYNDTGIPYQLCSRVNIIYLTANSAKIQIQRFNTANQVLTDGISNQFTILMKVSNS